MESGEGQHDEAEDEGDQDNQHQRGGEGLEKLLSHLRDAGAAATAACAWATGARVAAAAGVGGSEGPVEETRRQRQPQLLGRPGTHRRWAGRGWEPLFTFWLSSKIETNCSSFEKLDLPLEHFPDIDSQTEDHLL